MQPDESVPTINPLFAYHKLNDAGIAKAGTVGGLFHNLVESLKNVCPEGREWSIVKTKLEEACFFAKKAVAVKEENQA